jgi:hypothetical protein
MKTDMELANAIIDSLVDEMRDEIDLYRAQVVREVFLQRARHEYNRVAGGTIGPFGAAGRDAVPDISELQALILDREQTMDALAKLRDLLNDGAQDNIGILTDLGTFLSSQKTPMQSYFYSTWTEENRQTRPLF